MDIAQYRAARTIGAYARGYLTRRMVNAARAQLGRRLTTLYRPSGVVTKRMSNRPGTRTVRKFIKRVIKGDKETHFVDYNWGKTELYHNSYNTGSFIGKLNGTPNLPSQGDGDSNRTGNDIYARGISCKIMFGAKADRKNTTFRVMVLRTTKGYALTPYGQVFDNQTGNIMLDGADKDRVKVLYDKKHFQKVYVDQGIAAKEVTFFRKIYIPHKTLYKFYDDGVNDNSYPYDLHLVVMAYDAYGSLTTDNVGYCQVWSRFLFKDK